ncbi:3'-5' exonuclease [Staphylospora marina]|uniref:3'-5' exonuclease n=1 Tax=Staphylospora marina TaxID=2490858 RepID=UPI000F5BE026|nr:3'-5' exonuclease [Staphylospora marina]
MALPQLSSLPLALPQLSSLPQAYAQADFNEWNEREDIVILDTETTGIHDAEICEIGVVDRNGNVLFHSLVKPTRPITEEAAAIHGITPDMLAEAPGWPEVWERLFPIIRGKLILIYNKAFERRVMIESFKAHGMSEPIRDVRTLNMECVMDAYANLIGSPKWVKLSEAVGRPVSHRALDDARATAELVRRCHDPRFTKDMLRRAEDWNRLVQVTNELEEIRESIQSLTRRMNDLLKEQAALHGRLILNEAEPEAAAAKHDEETGQLPPDR